MILVYICEDRLSKLIPRDFLNREGFFLELNLRTNKYVLCCSYSPHTNFIETDMDSIGKVIDSLFARYENFILVCDFNTEESDTTVKDFCDFYSFKDLINEATCFKNPDKLKCIYLMLKELRNYKQKLFLCPPQK